MFLVECGMRLFNSTRPGNTAMKQAQTASLAQVTWANDGQVQPHLLDNYKWL